MLRSWPLVRAISPLISIAFQRSGCGGPRGGRPSLERMHVFVVRRIGSGAGSRHVQRSPVDHLDRGMWGSGRAADPAGWLPMVATGSAFFMIVLDTSIVNLALARIGAEFGAGLSTL